MRRLFENLSFLLMVAIFVNCGTFIGNPDRIGADGPDTKDKRVEENSNANESGEIQSDKISPEDGVIYDEMNEISSDSDVNETAGMPDSRSSGGSRIVKVTQGFVNALESNREHLPLESSSSSVQELKDAIAANMYLPKLAIEDFVDHFSDFPQDSFVDPFKVSYNLTESLWNTDTYLLSIIIDSNELEDGPYFDVKSFIEFNSSVVSKFKLLGYQHENGRALDDKIRLVQLDQGSRKTLAFEIILLPASLSPEANLFSLNISYLKQNTGGTLMKNSVTTPHNLSRLNISNQAQTLLNANIAFTMLINEEVENPSIKLKEVKDYLQTNRSNEPGLKWLEFESLINSISFP
ncbi:MAG: hypothetical protein AB8G05_22225 [Oligoflexales bacterium]